MDMLNRIDELLGKEAYLIDIFPATVPQKDDNRYFAIEEMFQRDRADIDRKFRNVLLKLYCYYDFTVCYEDKTIVNPSPEQLASQINDCLSGNLENKSSVNIILPECDSLIVLDHEYLYMVVYNADDQLKNLLSQVAAGEGLFFYAAP